MGKCTSVPQKSQSLTSISYTSKTIESDNEYLNIKQVPNFLITDTARQSILASLSKVHIFQGLTQAGFDIIIKSIKYCVAESLKTIFHQGSKGTLYFIINSGSVEIIVNGKQVTILEKGSCFGEMALLSDSIRRATVKTLSKSSFWVLSNTSFFQALKTIYKQNYDEAHKLLINNYFFHNLPESQIEVICNISSKGEFNNGEVILKEGVKNQLLFILKSGCVECKRGSELLFIVDKPGDIFAEDSLINDKESQFTCASLGHSEVISINLVGIKEALGENYEKILLKNIAKNSLMRDEYLRFVNSEKAIDISINTEFRSLNKGDPVFQVKKKAASNKLIIVCIGKIGVKERKESFLGAYQVIGLGNLNEKKLVSGDYVALEKCIIGEISVSKLNEIMERDSKSLISELQKLRFLKTVNFFNSVSFDSLKEISKCMKHYNVIKGTRVFRYHDRSSKIYLVKSGVFEIRSNEEKLLRIATKFDYFGEKCLYEDFRTASVYCVEEGEFYAVKALDLSGLRDFPELLRTAKERGCIQKSINIEETVLVKEYPNKTGRRRFSIKSRENQIYDLTVIPKSSFDTEKDCFKLVQEKELMIQMDHKLINKLVSSYKDSSCIYFITEHLNGVALSSVENLKENTVKTLALYLLEIIEYLHQKNIVYRDISPDNVFLSDIGVPYLANFMNSKVLKGRTYSKVGTPYYRSPEMIQSRGYTKSTDIWSFGVLLFELVYKKLPFSICDKDSPNEAYDKILTVVHGFDSSVDKSVNSLLETLLCPSDRRADMNSIIRNDWFTNVDRERVNKRLSVLPSNQVLNHAKNDCKEISTTKIMNVIFIQQTSPNQISEEVLEFNWDEYF